MKMLNRLLLPLVLLLAASSRVSAQEVDADDQFTKLADEYIDGYLAWRPATGTSLGLHDYDGKITDYSRSSLRKEHTRLQRFDRELAAIPTASLSPRNFHDYQVLRASIANELFGFDEMRGYERNPMTYAGVFDVTTYIKRNFAPLEDRVRSIIAIEKQAPHVFIAAHSNLDGSLPRPYIETAIEVATGSADFLGKDLVDALKDVKDPALMTEFNAANKLAIEQLRAFADYLQKVKMPRANTNYALGRLKFEKMIRDGELIPLSSEMILELGMRRLKAEQQRFAEAAHEIDPNRKPIEVFKEIQKDHPTAESLIPDVRRDLDTIHQFIVDRHIVTLPSERRVKVEETPQFARATSFASMDAPGPFETRATEAFYYVTPVESDWTPQQKEEWLTAFNYYTTDVVSMHEAYPGHFVQFMCEKASPANRLEKMFGSYAFIEGWAHYCEQMMIDEGYGAGDPANPTPDDKLRAAKYRLAQSDEALLRLCRLCVAIKMHCEGMSVDDATKFFEDNCYYEHKPAHDEAMRGTFDPEYLYYTLGKLQFLKLRADYQRQEGSAFSLERFHDEVLRHGCPPVHVLREILLRDHNKWDDLF